MAVIIRGDQRGLLFEKGSYVKHLSPGKYNIGHFGEKEILIMKLNESFKPEGWDINIFLNDEDLTKELSLININDNEIVLHYIDNKFSEILLSGKYAFWNILSKHKFITIDTNNPIISDEVDKSILSLSQIQSFITNIDVEGHEKGLLFFNNKFQKILEPGKYYFWNGPITANAQLVDMRQQQLDMTGQEIMTLDKVALRLNFVCHYKITNPYKIVIEIKDYSEQIYIVLQLILREYIGSLTLDELLRKKEEIGEFVLSRLRKKQDDFGIEFVFVGVKDIILPGEIKDILNKVLIAQKEAQANVITRREETASTRSLLNTAKLMDENKTLFKLKEMEFLEKIADKIGTISINGAGSILEQLNKLLNNKVKD